MALPKSLINQFAKVTNDNTKTKKESIVYGTIPSVGEDGKLWVNPEDPSTNTGISPSSDADEIYVHLDGSYDSNGKPKLVKINTTVKTAAKDRVIISIRNHMAVVTGNLTTPSTTVEHVTQVETTISNKMETEYLTADEIEAAYVQTTQLESDYINAETIRSTYATINSLNTKYGEFTTLKGDYAGFKQAYTEYLNALNADVYSLDADVAHINELMFGSSAGEVIQASFASAVFALIESISTKNVKIASDDESLVIHGNLIQVKDADGSVRVQIGKDATGTYSILVCDKNGATMLDASGITENAIKNAIIVNNMISDSANISGSKLDIDSVIDTINENGSTSIKSTKIYFDEKDQTLDSVFAEFTSDVDTLDTKYTEIHQDLNSVRTTVADHNATLTETGTQLEVTKSTVEQLVDSISMLVTDGNGTSLMTQTGDGWTFNIGAIQSAIDDLGVMSEYIRIGTYEDEPCIELGEGDSNFKLLITNTRIMFMDGSDIPAYINNKSLYIKKAVIEEELQQGGYSWVTRSNGHLSLVWKGVTE